MPRRMKYAPHLVTISETSTMSKEKESPPAEVQEGVVSTRSKDARIERSHSAPPEAEASDRHMPTTASKRGRSQSAKCLLLHSLNKPETETRATSPTTKDKQPVSPKKATNTSGDKQVIKKILQTEPELLYQADNRGNHPLHYAGASVNALNDRHQTPLLISVISNDDDDDKVARILLFHHAKPMIKVTDDLMLAQYASSRDFTRSLRPSVSTCEYGSRGKIVMRMLRVEAARMTS
ncbi:Ankyrin repeat-containing domain [Phytophthora cactorum]|nr:Ankyrin repeat-containing domain [Phytophthora cactorum]